MNTVYEVADAFFLVYAGLFPIVNPIGNAPIFLGLTQHCSNEERNAAALQVALNCFFLLLGSFLIGSYVLEFFGITLPIVRIAGGLVVSATGWKLLQAGNDFAAADRAGHQPVTPIDPFYPLAMPITVGPGSIAVAIALGSERPREAFTQLGIYAASAIGGLVAITLTIYVCYRFAEGTVGALGERGIGVVVRLCAFILFCIGIEVVWSGYSALVPIAS